MRRDWQQVAPPLAASSRPRYALALSCFFTLVAAYFLVINPGPDPSYRGHG